jgi:hypothetical protein
MNQIKTLASTFRCSSLALVVAMCGASAGCATDTLDPKGNWNMTWTWGTGDCGLTGTQADSETITQDSTGKYVLSTTQPGITVTGMIACTATSCQMSMSQSGVVMGNNAMLSANLTLKSDKSVSGSGSISFAGDVTCSQPFTATGSKQ